MEAPVSSIMGKKPEMVDPDTTVRKAAAILASDSEECLIVEKDDLLVGIVTSEDIIEKVIAVGADPERVYAKDIMSTPVVIVNETASIKQAAEMMSNYGVRKLPVVDGSGALAGIITSLELARWMAKMSDFQDPALNALAKVKDEGRGGPYR